MFSVAFFDFGLDALSKIQAVVGAAIVVALLWVSLAGAMHLFPLEKSPLPIYDTAVGRLVLFLPLSVFTDECFAVLGDDCCLSNIETPVSCLLWVLCYSGGAGVFDGLHDHRIAAGELAGLRLCRRQSGAARSSSASAPDHRLLGELTRGARCCRSRGALVRERKPNTNVPIS